MTEQARTVVSMSVGGDEANAQLDAIAQALNVSKAKALRAALELASLVYADSEAAKFHRPADALEAYTARHGVKV